MRSKSRNLFARISCATLCLSFFSFGAVAQLTSSVNIGGDVIKGIVIDNANNVAYISQVSGNGVSIFDLKKNKVTSTMSTCSGATNGESPELAFNPRDNRLYMQDSNRVTVFDTQKRTCIKSITVNSGANGAFEGGIAYDQNLHTILYVSNGNFSSTANVMYYIDADSYEITSQTLNTPKVAGQLSMAYDNVNSIAYLWDANNFDAFAVDTAAKTMLTPVHKTKNRIGRGSVAVDTVNGVGYAGLTTYPYGQGTGGYMTLSVDDEKQLQSSFFQFSDQSMFSTLVNTVSNTLVLADQDKASYHRYTTQDNKQVGSSISGLSIVRTMALDTENNLIYAGGNAGAINILAIPTITGFSSQEVTYGQEVTIVGNNFASKNTQNVVMLNGKMPVVPTKSSSTSITLTIPENATSGYVTVVSNNIPSTNSPMSLLIGNKPVVSKMVPNVVEVGDTVTLMVEDLKSGANSVTLGSQTIDAAKVASGQVKFTVPQHARTGRLSLTSSGITGPETLAKLNVVEVENITVPQQEDVVEDVSTALSLMSVTKGDKGFVAVGERGKIIYSKDGENWKWAKQPTQSNGSPFGYLLRSVCEINGTYYAYTGETHTGSYVLTSTDTINWTINHIEKSKDNGWCSNTTYAYLLGTKFGTYDTIATSSDGITWATVLSSNDNNLYLLMKQHSDRYLAASRYEEDGYSNIYTSNNGAYWQGPYKIESNNGDGKSKVAPFFASAAWSDSLAKYAAVVNYREIWTSLDGQNWEVAYTHSKDIAAVHWNKWQKIFVVASSDNKILASNDGVTWGALDYEGDIVDFVSYQYDIIGVGIGSQTIFIEPNNY